jgi:hypothetical protein
VGAANLLALAQRGRVLRQQTQDWAASPCSMLPPSRPARINVRLTRYRFGFMQLRTAVIAQAACGVHFSGVAATAVTAV